MTESMTAARLHKIGNRLRIDRIGVPAIAAKEVLVDVRASGICHSDINYRKGVAPVGRLPITLGHEIAGVVTKTGKMVKGVWEGDRVIIHYIVSCGKCVFCLTNRENYCAKYQMMGKDIDGGFAEYVRVPVRNVVKLSRSIPFELGAIMGCAVPTAYHALRRARVQPNDTVVVVGVGGLGIHAIQLASKVFKVGRIIAVDLLTWKLRLAKQLGAKETINPATQDFAKTVEKITSGRLADVVLDFVGLNQTIPTAIDCVGKGGRLVLVGIGAKSIRVSPYKTIIGREMEIVGVDDHLKSEMIELENLVRSKKIDISRSVTHKVALEEVNRGFQILEENIGDPLRVVAVS